MHGFDALQPRFQLSHMSASAAQLYTDIVELLLVHLPCASGYNVVFRLELNDRTFGAGRLLSHILQALLPPVTGAAVRPVLPSHRVEDVTVRHFVADFADEIRIAAVVV